MLEHHRAAAALHTLGLADTALGEEGGIAIAEALEGPNPNPNPNPNPHPNPNPSPNPNPDPNPNQASSP